MITRTRTHFASFGPVVLASIALGACSQGTPSGGGGGSAYVVSVGIFTEDGALGYLAAVDSLSADTSYSLDKAVELEAGANIFGTGDDGSVYVATFTSPSITRWQVQSDGAFEKGPTVSFADLGVTSAFAASLSPFLTKERAYFVDSDSHQVVVWNPTTMTLIKTIPLDLGDAVGSLAPRVDTTLTVRDDAVIANVYWRDDDWLRFGEKVRVITIDPRTDAVVATADDTRANQLTPGGLASNGSAYFSPSSTISPVRSVFGDGYGARDTSLRLAPQGRQYESAFGVDLDALVGGRPAGDLTMLSDDVAFVRVWHSELVQAATPANWGDVQYEPGYRWWRWRLGDADAHEIPGQDAGSGGVVLLRADKATYATKNAADFSTTTLLKLDASGAIEPGLTGPGTILGLVQVRVL